MLHGLRKLGVGAAAFLTMLFGTSALAVDADPGDYTPLEAGTNLAVLYTLYTHSGTLRLQGTGFVSQGSSLDSAITILRYVYYTKLGPFTIDPQIIMPAGSLYDAKVGGKQLSPSSGVGDVTPFATIWLIDKPDPVHATYFGISPIVTVPTGQYDYRKELNIGTHRFIYDAQAGLVQGVIPRVTLYLFSDLVWYGDNDAYGSAKSTLRQSMTSELQIWLRYALPSGKNWLSIGYAGYWGGKQTVDGLFNGTRTEHQQVRVAVQTMLTDTIELEEQAGRDVSVRDGFRDDARIQLRLLKLF